ncbi:MAG TPA: prolyl oligopeptidase family serine peptidase [Thermoanaerobaculia bacterium]|nr:prolyl oligopeptidase family serine peptidase [Thermoanaerobaculia bacterium]
MFRKIFSGSALVLFSLAGTGQAAEMVSVPESIAARNVPAIPRERVEALLPYENIRTADFAGWHPTDRRMLIRTRFAESVQLHEVATPMGARVQLTFYEDPVSGGQYRPNAPDQVVFALNEGGAENFQLFLLDRKTGRQRRFTDGKHRYQGGIWSKAGKLLAYVGNARNGKDFDLYVSDPAVPGSERRVAELDGSWFATEWSPDGKRILLRETISANESYLHWVEIDTGTVHAITPRGSGQEQVAWGSAAWSKDGRSIYTTTDRGSELTRLVRLDPESGATTVLSGDIPWDVTRFDLSEDGQALAFFTNEDGIDKLHLLDTRTGKALPAPELPPGVTQGMGFRPGSHEIAFAMSWARSSRDVYSYDPDTRKLERWTASEVGGLNPDSFVVPELVRYPTFDTDEKGARRTIPAFVYRPDPNRFQGPRPVYINIHGGPEGQSQPSFLQSNNYLLDELGIALVYPNVRGSTGYGKTYLKLDNGAKREDSVKDIGALLDWIKTQPGLDASRVMVSGGSYGGYMVLASLVHYGDRLRCGYDSVGISNFVTFLENTQDYRRDLRRVEYGDERDPEMRKVLEQISPSNRVDRLNRPLLVSQGANDPRVPLSESDQIVEALQSKGVPVWYLVAKNEGHGFRRKSTSDYLRAVLMEFVERCLLGSGEGLKAAGPTTR